MKVKKFFTILFGIIALAILLFLFSVLIGIGAIYYNNNLSPPAKLRDKISIGQNYNQVIELFNEYEERYKNNEDVAIAVGKTDERLTRHSQYPEGKYIHLYHWIFMDDLHLTIYFDKNNIVKHIEFVGD